jgi:hypothetical protein
VTTTCPDEEGYPLDCAIAQGVLTFRVQTGADCWYSGFRNYGKPAPPALPDKTAAHRRCDSGHWRGGDGPRPMGSERRLDPAGGTCCLLATLVRRAS